MVVADMAGAAAGLMARVRAEKPLVHHITNFVVMNETANITLCAGALPVMAHAKEEVEEMTSAAKALVLNIGTLWPEQIETMLLAGHCANQCGVPIVLDPVGAGATRLRTDTGRRLLEELSIAITRANAAEIAALSGYEVNISGVESRGVVGNPEELAKKFARQYGCVAAMTGAVDIVTDGTLLARVANGHPMMTLVTGTGCMATSVVAAYAAVETDFVAAGAIALAAYGLAGEIAARNAKGPGSLHVELYDALAGLDEQSLRAGLRIEVARQ
jgi:hydroxyethylthiazole kinase